MNARTFSTLVLAIATFPLTLATAQAAHLSVATITTDAIQGEITLYGDTDADGSLVNLNYTKPNADPTVFPIANLKDGIVLFSAQGQDVVVLQSDTFDPKSGGSVNMHYLFNGLTGRHHDFGIEVDRTGDSWSALVNETTGRRAFTKMYLKANKVWGQIVGIASVTVQ